MDLLDPAETYLFRSVGTVFVAISTCFKPGLGFQADVEISSLKIERLLGRPQEYRASGKERKEMALIGAGWGPHMLRAKAAALRVSSNCVGKHF